MAIIAGWQIRQRYAASQSHADKVLSKSVPVAPAPPTPITPAPAPIQAQSYYTVAEKLLFFKDRNSTVVIEQPKEPVVPQFPAAYGVMDFGSGATAVMSESPGAEQKSYRAGDKIGEFLLASLTTKEVVLEWHGKKFTKLLDDLKVKDAPPPAAAATEASNSFNSGSKTRADDQPFTKNLGEITSTNEKASAKVTELQQGLVSSNAPGIDSGAGTRMCAAGDNSPPGTVQGGFRKVTRTSFTGLICMWEPIGR
jgi:hypothetical protein